MNFDGTDLNAFVSLDLPTMPVSLNGPGNCLNYSIRTAIADDFLYLGSANPMNMETGGELKGGREPCKLRDDDACGSYTRG